MRGARSGVVTLVQRHGSAAKLNLYMLVLEGVHKPIAERVRFHSVPAPSNAQLQAPLTRMIARIRTFVSASDMTDGV